MKSFPLAAAISRAPVSPHDLVRLQALHSNSGVVLHSISGVVNKHFAVVNTYPGVVNTYEITARPATLESKQVLVDRKQLHVRHENERTTNTSLARHRSV